MAAAAAPKPVPPRAGIKKEQRAEIIKHFTMLAFSDLHHDFGTSYLDELMKALPMSSKIDSVQLKANAREISSKFVAKQQKVSSTKRWNLYDELAGYMLNILPEEGGIKEGDVKNAWKAEETVIQPYGINLPAIKTELVTRNLDKLYDDKLYEPYELYESRAITIPKNDEGKVAFTRNYNIKAMPYKIDGKHIPIGAVFEKLTGKQDFTMVIDAGNMPLTELAKINNIPGNTREDKIDMIEDSDDDFKKKFGIDKNKPYTFRILESIENTSDPAGKVKNFKKYLDSSVKILKYKDNGHSSTFSNFNDATENANFFSNINFITSYTDSGNVKATFTLNPSNEENEDNEAKHIIDNLGNDSEIGRAATLSIIKYVEDYPDIIKKNPDIDKIKEVVLYPMMKRAGDWCQALCLLDTVRSYDFKQCIYKVEEPAEDKNPITLDGVKGSSAVGLMTHDQILLAYSLLIGINVYLTLSTPAGKGKRISWLLYFNNLDTSKFDKNILETQTELNAKIDKLEIDINAAKDIQESSKITLETKLNPFKTSRTEETVIEAREYLYKLFSYIRIKQSIIDFDGSLDAEVTKLKEMINGLNSDNGYNVIMEVETYIKNIDSLIANNEQQYALINIIETIPWALPKKPEDLKAIRIPFKDEYTIISNVFQDILAGKNIASLNNYKQLSQEVYIPIKKYLDKMAALDKKAAVDNKYTPSYKAPKTITIDTSSKPGRISGISENTKRIQGDIKELFSAHVPMAGGVRFEERKEEKADARIARISEILKDSFYKIRSNLVVPYWPVGAASELGIKKGGNIEKELKKTTAEHYLAPISNYVVDNHANYYSILDKYIVTIDDCYKFISIYGDECDFLKIRPFSKHLTSTKGSQEEGKRIIDNIFGNLKTKTHSSEIFINEYLNLRMCLLMHDILYTTLLNLTYRFNSLIGDKLKKLLDESIIKKLDKSIIEELDKSIREKLDESIRGELNDFNSDLTILKDKLNTIGILVAGATTRKFKDMHILEQYKTTLFEIRKSIFTQYYLGPPRGKSLYKKLNSYEFKEVNDYRKTLTIKEDHTSFEQLIINDNISKQEDLEAIGPREQEPKEIEKGGAASGGRRITRRRKDKNAKTTRKSKRTTRRRV